MIPLAANPAVTDPRKMLNLGQRRALLAIRDYRRQVSTLSGVAIGPHRFDGLVITALERHGLIRGRIPNLTLTEAGQLAASRLKEA
ncbi:MAG: hypothetical protein QMD99_13690 [Rhizobiaceae bacterium]|nr:hypothetical protein [Rhizobiaceae bacterium]